MERIDVHVHYVPAAYRTYCKTNAMAGYGHPDGMPQIPEWSLSAQLEFMDRLHISRSILSMSSPGTHLSPGNDEEARKLTRQANTDMANLCREHPSRLSFFASLPLPDVDGSLAEIDFALDHLGAVGFQILTNSHGVYPGDERLERVFARLSERKAIVFIHPTSCCIQNTSSGSGSSGTDTVTGTVTSTVTTINPQPNIPSPVVEFMFDSTRAIMSLLLAGTLQRYPNITFVSTHCAATLPPVFQRIVDFSGPLFGPDRQLQSHETKQLLQTRFYFDLAGLPFPDQIHGLLRLVDSSRLLYGSDFPYTPAPLAEAWGSRLDKGLKEELHADVRTQVLQRNALEMFDRAGHSLES